METIMDPNMAVGDLVCRKETDKATHRVVVKDSNGCIGIQEFITASTWHPDIEPVVFYLYTEFITKYKIVAIPRS